jgi:Fic family protein
VLVSGTTNRFVNQFSSLMIDKSVRSFYKFRPANEATLKSEVDIMLDQLGDLDFSKAVSYHTNQFPPSSLRYEDLIQPLSWAVESLSRYDQMLMSLKNSEILLAPLSRQEAVVSSRIEGTVSTLDEVLRYESEHGDADLPDGRNFRSEAVEVFLYERAMREAQKKVKEGYPINSWLIRSAHKTLLGFGRGAKMTPGEFKTDLNYIADKSQKRILFVPIAPENLEPALNALFAYMDIKKTQILIRTAISHLEFEALHPFRDGNGRIGRMLITLMLWKNGAISAPNFYISSYFEENRDAYIDQMREVSRTGDWTNWVMFFLTAIKVQADNNLEKAEEVVALYDVMKERFRELTNSQWSMNALDCVFSRPIFAKSSFAKFANMPPAPANRMINILTEAGVLETLVPSAGSRPAIMAFEPLLKIVRG